MNAFERPAAGVSPVLSVRNLSVTYLDDDKPTVADCTFDVYPGECVLLTGPSGSGKSTIAMAIAGIIPRSVEAQMSGEIQLGTALKAPGKIGYVFQDPNSQFCMLTVEDEIAFGLENLRIPRESMPAKIDSALRRVRLDVNQQAHHADFSGGMKQKLAIASALAMDCELIILDEPTANLDPQSTREVFERIAELRSMGRTLLIVEHKYEPLLPYIDRVLTVAPDGRVHRGATADLLSQRARRPSRQLPSSHAHAGHPVLQLSDVSLAYAKHSVWSHISAAFYKGEWVAIVGPNGAGKSSLLEVMAGLTPPTAGRVSLCGENIEQVRPGQRYQTIAYGFQNPEYQFLFERVADEMAGRLVGDVIPPHVEALLAEFGLKDHAGASPYALSQGQKRRLAVGVMLRDDHDVFLFDEPTYGQDASSEETILSRLVTLLASGKTVVTVTHDLEIVRRYATRVLVIAQGELLFDGGVNELFEREDVLRRAHLIDDVRPLRINVSKEGREQGTGPMQTAHSAAGAAEGAALIGVSRGYKQQTGSAECKASARSPMSRIHPGVKLLTLLVVAVLTLFANTFRELGSMWVVTLVIAFGLGWCNPWRAFKRLSVVLAMYVIYLWTFAANAATPPGYHYVNFLWFHLSVYGLLQGVLVALRTFSTVVLAYVFLETTDGTNFVVSLSQSFRLPPKLAYGIMAGTGFLQRFDHELRTFRLARRVRGRQGWWVTRPVTYALPMLSQSIRLSERLATAMEARGFYGAPADKWDERSYFRRISFAAGDFLFAGLCVVGAVLLFFV
ncbi:ATP-binding cassette domain-containing protein [Alicyclobacillus fastidiosus]|uniref:ATP-binding cassette domain-containing protein n=1 Tax=Alicyclobacillus fastidiosus TaxID=392011 RepID=A0ABY6ZDN1_9BACL|nr:ATP-binding cassette domain-containing protein [Alicyclobacillus fastidiosus]WAH40903.1 ATP-binding cassette domain-containing protein [Alicyclobacillus fastidiosus]GMA62397.1 hypothetical protein GCM10025859_28370 [Alicyclobacillus fastidiosus]